MSAPNAFVWVNAALFQLTWFGCVLGGVLGGAAGLAALLVAAAWCGTLRDDLRLLAPLAIVGFALDSVWQWTGIVGYTGAAVAPLWIVMLWGAVALTLNHSLRAFTRRPLLGGLVAGLAAPVSYLTAARLGAVAVPDPALLIYPALAWSVVFFTSFSRLVTPQEELA